MLSKKMKVEVLLMVTTELKVNLLDMVALEKAEIGVPGYGTVELEVIALVTVQLILKVGSLSIVTQKMKVEILVKLSLQ